MRLKSIIIVMALLTAATPVMGQNATPPQAPAAPADSVPTPPGAATPTPQAQTADSGQTAGPGQGPGAAPATPAPAGPVAPTPTPRVAADDGSGLIGFLTDGKDLPAVGALLVLLIGGIRTGLKKLSPWFGTQAGGYAVAWITTAITYIGTALQSGTGLTLRLFLVALATGFVACGILTHWQDASDAGKAKMIKMKMAHVKATTVTLLMGLMVACSSCNNIPQPIHDVIECTGLDETAITSEVAKLVTLIPNGWPAVLSQAIADGLNLGSNIVGCAFAEVTQDFLAKKGATVGAEQTHAARDAFEEYRQTHAGNKTFRTKKGDL